jgi:hypothetical protein
MNLKLRKGWWIALPVALIALFTPIIAFASSVVPQDTSIFVNQSNLALDDSFEVSNFTPTDVILTTVTVSGVSGVTFSIPTNTGLTREFGYNSWTNVSTIAFTGNQVNTNNALDSMTVSTGASAGIATLSVSVQKKVAGSTAYYDGTGNYYEFVQNNSITYMQARTAASQRTLNGIQGYLVTITSDAEHNFVLSKIQGAYDIWISLSDREAEGVWKIDSGPEAGTVVWNGLWNGSAPSGRYAKWCGGEPNDSGSEDAAVTKWGGGNCWNDLPHDNYYWVGGYVVEYDAPQNQVFTDSMDITVQQVPPTTTTTTTTVPPTTTTTVPPTTTTTLPPYFNAVGNLVATANQNGSVSLDWDVPTESNLSPHMYDVSWFDLNNDVESGGWGVWTYATNTEYNVGSFQFPNTTGYGLVRFKVRAGNGACVGEGQGSCVYGPYATVDVDVIDPTPPTTTTTSTTTTTTTVPQTTSTTTSTTSTTTIPPTTSSTSTTTTTTTLPPETTTTTVYVPPATTTSTTTTTEPPVTTTTEPEEETTTTTEPEETTTTEPEEETTTTTEPEEESTTTTEPVTETTEPEPVVDTTILENEEDPVEEEENTPPVTIPEGIQSSQEAVGAILKIDVAEAPVEELKEVFKAIEPDELTDEQKEAIIEVIQNAPQEVKEAFEEEVDIYGGGFDNYVPVGSTIDVGARKTVIAAIATLTATTTLAAVPPSSGSSPTGGSSGGSGGGSSGGGGSTGEARSRKEEESGDEPAGEIAGPEDDDDTDYAHNSIFKYYIKEGIEMKKFNWFGFSKKLWDITAGLAFTLAGSFVVYITLSGTTQRLAGIATLIALFIHYLHEILKNDME